MKIFLKILLRWWRWGGGGLLICMISGPGFHCCRINYPTCEDRKIMFDSVFPGCALCMFCLKPYSDTVGSRKCWSSDPTTKTEFVFIHLWTRWCYWNLSVIYFLLTYGRFGIGRFTTEAEVDYTIQRTIHEVNLFFQAIEN
jgi:hypothetical protein